MRILAIDVGTGTQDILLFDTDLVVENCPKLVVPSATAIIAQRVARATRQGTPILLTGVTMGGGPCAWAVEAHLKTGLPVYAMPDAARTFDDHLENVEAMGITIVSEDEAAKLNQATHIEMQDLDLPAVHRALEAFDVDPHYDGLAVAVFDHGAAPRDVSDRTFRFDHLRHVLERENDLHAFGYLPEDLPTYLTRMRSVADTYRGEADLVLLDTASAGALGTLGDPRVAMETERLLVNLGNMHATAFHLQGTRVLSLFEHHTGLIDRPKLEHLVGALKSGGLSNAEVFDDHGHGAHRFGNGNPHPLLAVTGPQRALLQGSPLQPYFAVPHGDMMLSGCFGLVRAFAHRYPRWQDETARRLVS